MKKSDLIVPISIVVHLCIINGVLFLFTPETYLNTINIGYYNISWLVIAYSLNFYPTSRKERFMTNFHKLLQLYLIFGLAYFALFTFQQFNPQTLEHQLFVFGFICIGITIYRGIFYYTRSVYRAEGGNSVNVVVIGRDRNLKKIRSVFDEPDLGYRYKGYFANEVSGSPTYLGTVKASLQYILDNDIDQIFCMVSQLTREELKLLITFADNNLKKLKIIPDNKEIYTRAMTIELYGNVPVLNMRKLPLDTDYAQVIKRAFDVLFSGLIILTVLSWLTPLLYIILKLESKGPLFFKQKRHGVNRKAFLCYKFRSMRASVDANNKMATKQDKRITSIGRILRRTSIDELPQFFNVFIGNMSVVGPRPHMEMQTWEYETSVDKYLVRHFVKPVITGLAQIRGYRGEIINKLDIINRVKLDIFYIEKWSLLLDVKIIGQTVRNAVKGEEKAY